MPISVNYSLWYCCTWMLENLSHHFSWMKEKDILIETIKIKAVNP